MVRNQRHNIIAICLIFEAARSPCGAAAGGGSWDGRIDGALLGMGKRGFALIRVGRDVSMIQEAINSPTGSNDSEWPNWLND